MWFEKFSASLCLKHAHVGRTVSSRLVKFLTIPPNCGTCIVKKLSFK